MAHLRSCEVRQLLHNKFVVVMGDSVQRAVYKDLVVLLQRDCLLSTSQLKTKGELTFEGDVLLEGGRWGRMHNGTHYREVRQYRSAHHLLRFYFLTRAFSPYAAEVLEELRAGPHAPDLVVLNSCLWDLSRGGGGARDFRRGYREDLGSLFGLLGQALPEPCLRVWNTAMPVAEVVSGGFLLPEQQLRGAHLRLDVMEANFYSAVEAGRHGFDVLDLHFHFRHAGQHRQRDGVHWDQRAHRHLSQLLLAHVADAWGVDLPRRCPVGRWLRDGAGGQAGPAAAGCRQQPRESGGDAGRQALTGSTFLLPSAAAQPRPLFPSFGPSALVPALPSLQAPQFCSSLTTTLQVEYTFHTTSRLGLEHRLGPIRRVSIQPQSRGSPPYPLQPLGRPRRQRRRHSQGHGQTEN